jgi:bifunctional oligoribonuclease and PAP phosphatase NrnA
MNPPFPALWNEIQKHKNIIVSLHIAPDGDSLGSCTALKYVLERDGIATVTVVSSDNLEQTLMGHPIAKDVQFTDIATMDLEPYDALICLDTGSKYRISSQLHALPSIPIINIDHHASNERYGTVNYIDPVCASTCSLLVDLFRAVNVRFDKELSTRLLLGVCTDSNFFTVGRNAVDSFEKASFLIKHGADYVHDILEPVLLAQPLKLKQYASIVLQHLRVDEKRRIAYSAIPYDAIAHLDLSMAEIRKAIRYIADVKDCDIKFFLVELPTEMKGSLRSIHTPIHLAAEGLGGGGHHHAAGITLPKQPLDEAVACVFTAIDTYTKP